MGLIHLTAQTQPIRTLTKLKRLVKGKLQQKNEFSKGAICSFASLSAEVSPHEALVYSP